LLYVCFFLFSCYAKYCLLLPRHFCGRGPALRYGFLNCFSPLLARPPQEVLIPAFFSPSGQVRAQTSLTRMFGVYMYTHNHTHRHITMSFSQLAFTFPPLPFSSPSTPLVSRCCLPAVRAF
jgi:hypothetical protein